MTNPQTPHPLEQFDGSARSVYVGFGDHPVEAILAGFPEGTPPHVVHFAKIGDDYPGRPAEVRMITPLGEIDGMELGCLESIFWSDGTVIHFYVDSEDEELFVNTIGNTGIGAEYLGS